MMVSLCGVMEMEIYNSKQEIGCRILLILVCTKKKMQAETISVYDYFSVHIDDIFSELPCLHPSNPNHSYLEIETLNNDVFTIRRDFNDKNNAYWIYSKFEDINDDTSFEKIKAESKTDKNISEKILSICGCNYKNLLKKTSTGETKNF